MNVYAQSVCRVCRLTASIAIFLLAASAMTARADDAPASTASWTTHAPEAPTWSLEIKAGRFEPELEEWATFYGDEDTDQLSFALGYKPLRWAEIGLAADIIRDEGVGTLPINDTLGGDVNFHLYPVHLYVLLRGVLFENQWIVPYVGGGVTRVYYRQEIDNQPSIRGKVEGEHVRFGLQILLDALDEGNAAGFEEESVDNTYLVIETLRLNAEIDGIELGGDTLQFGLLFEF